MTPQQSPIRTDLVIAMTLAESFLLLLFLVQYSAAGPPVEKPPPNCCSLADERQKEIQQLKRKISERESEIEKLQAAADYWEKNYNRDPPASTPELLDFLRSPQGHGVLTALGRGYQRCEDDNVLVRAAVIRGIASVEIVGESSRLSTWLAAQHIVNPPLHSMVHGWEAVNTFLSTVDNFYSSLPAEQACRFDYQLTWETYEDYHDGKKAFERTFYPAGDFRSDQ